MNSKDFANLLQQLKPELSLSVGWENWSKISSLYQDKLTRLLKSQNENEEQLLMTDLIKLFEPYNSALQLIDEFIRGPEALSQLVNLASQVGINETTINKLKQADVSELRPISVTKRPGKGPEIKSIKVQNYEFDIDEATELVVLILAACSDIFNKSGANYCAMAIGVWLTIRKLLKAITVDLSEQEAWAFWGLVLASGFDKKRVDTTKIMRSTNEERQKIHLPPVIEEQILHSLGMLESLKSIKRVYEQGMTTWLIIEEYKIKR